MTPNEAEQYIKTMEVNLAKVKRVRKPRLKFGDKVRFKLLKSVFEKGYTRTYSKEVHTIESIQGNNYTLDNGHIYRANRLQKVSKVDETPGEVVEPVNEVEEKVPLNKEEKKAQTRRRVGRAFDARYDRDIKEITDKGEVIYKPRYDTKHVKRQRVPNKRYEGGYFKS